MLGGLDEKVAGTGQDLELTAACQRLHRLTRHQRQQLVVIAVQSSSGRPSARRALAARRLVESVTTPEIIGRSMQPALIATAPPNECPMDDGGARALRWARSACAGDVEHARG